MAGTGRIPNLDRLTGAQGEALPQTEYDLYVLRRRRIWRPPTDVYETDSYVVVKVEVAGMQPDDFDISIVNRRLIISGNRRDPTGKTMYQNMEIRYGEFCSEVKLDWAVDGAAIEAGYEDGFLSVRLPRAKEYRIGVSSVSQH